MRDPRTGGYITAPTGLVLLEGTLEEHSTVEYVPRWTTSEKKKDFPTPSRPPGQSGQ